ncbi:hypothetical protein [Anaeromicropila populeti]|uniref:CobQ/CobB/MinD/ParA nucleotide binding domain-containing protein n=1 Tax=Anaeromicropila populeti TaxID=37658 RepID=A0A1I6JH18_9FIRM|nr:hypothetical protein [Anaeromicropila populeti]SFR77910.1 hypothetical protein SAMN05661086_01654 [Anaeromicropila populeti]
MIFYIAGEKNKEVFDFINDIYMFSRKVWTEEMSEKQFSLFIKQDLRNLDVEYLIVDYSVLKMEDTQLEQGIQIFKMLNPYSKVILYVTAPGQNIEIAKCILLYPSDPIEEKITNILTKSSVLPQQEEFLEEPEPKNEENNSASVQPESIPVPESKIVENLYEKVNTKVKTSEGKPLSKRVLQVKERQSQPVQEENMAKKQPLLNLEKYYCEQKETVQVHKWNCKNEIIAVLGTERKVGTTTAAFHLCQYLNSFGAKVVYTEANPHGHLQQIADAYSFEEKEGNFWKNGVTYYLNSQLDMTADNHFVLLDLGCIQERTDWVLKIIQDIASEIIVLSGSQIFEMDALKECLRKLSIMEKPIHVMMHSSEQELCQIRKQFENEAVTICKNTYEASLVATVPFAQEFQKMFEKYKE